MLAHAAQKLRVGERRGRYRGGEGERDEVGRQQARLIRHLHEWWMHEGGGCKNGKNEQMFGPAAKHAVSNVDNEDVHHIQIALFTSHSRQQPNRTQTVANALIDVQKPDNVRTWGRDAGATPVCGCVTLPVGVGCRSMVRRDKGRGSVTSGNSSLLNAVAHTSAAAGLQSTQHDGSRTCYHYETH